MEWYEPEVNALESHLRSQPPAPGSVAFYGSSSIRRWTTLAEDFPELPIVNLGFGGSTMQACAHFFDRLVAPIRPRSVVLYAGDNDIGDGHSPEAVMLSFGSILAKMRRQLDGTRIVCLAIKPSPARSALGEKILAANRMIAEALAAHPGGTFVDIHQHMLELNGQPRTSLFDEDGLHLSQDGYRLWASLLHAKLRSFA